MSTDIFTRIRTQTSIEGGSIGSAAVQAGDSLHRTESIRATDQSYDVKEQFAKVEQVVITNT